MGRRLKRVKLNGIPIRQICADCKVEFTEYRWSPFWCPECDAKRINRLSSSLDAIILKMGLKET
jgi:predicted RNA-binding Zn-ribbon protein involved in translation (DUF1610 family)